MYSWEGKKLDFTLKRHLPKRSFPNQLSLCKSIIARSIKAMAGKVSAQSLKRHQSSPWALTSKSLSRRLTCWARHLTGMDGVQQFCFYLSAFFFLGPELFGVSGSHSSKFLQARWVHDTSVMLCLLLLSTIKLRCCLHNAWDNGKEKPELQTHCQTQCCQLSACRKPIQTLPATKKSGLSQLPTAPLLLFH